MFRVCCLGVIAVSVLVAGPRGRQAGPALQPAASQPATAPAETTAPIGFAAVAAEGLTGTTGGAGGKDVTVATPEEFLAAIQGDEPKIIHVRGTIALPDDMHRVGSNTSILGEGTDAQLRDGGLSLRGVNNVIIRNLTFRGSVDDAICVTNRSHHVWIDHCDLAEAHDGLIDVVHQSSYVTVSWCRFSNHFKTILIGNSVKLTSDTGFLKVTLHHNWFDGTHGRHPRVRFGQVHVFNNLYERNSYGIVSNMGAQVVVEANYFNHVDRPTLVRYRDPRGGDLVERDNLFNSSGKPQTAGRAFDPHALYPYQLDTPDKVPDLVRKSAGVSKP